MQDFAPEFSETCDANDQTVGVGMQPGRTCQHHDESDQQMSTEERCHINKINVLTKREH